MGRGEEGAGKMVGVVVLMVDLMGIIEKEGKPMEWSKRGDLRKVSGK